MVRANAPNSGLNIKRHEMPISAGLMANGKMINVRRIDLANPARNSKIASPKATRMVLATSITTKRAVTAMTFQNSGSSVKAIR